MTVAQVGTFMALAGLIGAVLAPAPGRADGGAAVFAARCAGCHGPAGRADTMKARALKVEPLVNSPRLAAMTAAQIATLVKTSAKHQGVVALGDADIEAAAAYVRQVASER